MAVYSCRPDEEELFERFGKQYGIESVISSQAPVIENVDLAELRVTFIDIINTF